MITVIVALFFISMTLYILWQLYKEWMREKDAESIKYFQIYSHIYNALDKDPTPALEDFIRRMILELKKSKRYYTEDEVSDIKKIDTEFLRKYYKTKL
jgi:hypothetical protein